MNDEQLACYSPSTRPKDAIYREITDTKDYMKLGLVLSLQPYDILMITT